MTAVKPVPPKKGTAPAPVPTKKRPPVPGPETRGIPLDLARRDLSVVAGQLTAKTGVWHKNKQADSSVRDDIHAFRQEYRAFNGEWPKTLAVTAKTFADLRNDRGAIAFLANIRAQNPFTHRDDYTVAQYLAAYLGVDRIEFDEDVPGAQLR